MKILFTICGRAGSKGIKNKNSKDFLGNPLPYYALSVLDLFVKKNPQIEADIALSTDSDALAALVLDKLSIAVDYIPRPAELAEDKTAKIDAIRHTYVEMKELKGTDYDMVVDLDLTAPLRTIEDVENIISIKAEGDYDIVFSVTDSRRNPYFNMVMKSGDCYVRVLESNFNARQEAPEIFDMNAALYAYSPSYLLTGGGIFDACCGIYKMRDTAVLDLDNEIDFENMGVMASYLFEKFHDYAEVRDNIVNIVKNTN